MGFGMLCIVGWAIRQDIAFALLAQTVSANVVSHEVAREPFEHGGTLNAPSVSGIATVPLVTLRYIGAESRREVTCVVRGKMAVFGYRSVPKSNFRSELAVLARAPEVEALVKERAEGVECRLSRAIDPSILLLTAFIAVVTVVSAAHWRR